MQPVVGPPREQFTETQIRDLLTGDEIEVSAGLELLDSGNRFVADLSDQLEGGKVEHDGRQLVHGSVQLQITQMLAWGRDRVRPYLLLSNAEVSEARFNLGVFVLTTPQTRLGDDVIAYDVNGYDLLQLLQDGPGDTYVAQPSPAGDIVTNGGFETNTADWDSNPAYGAFTPATFARTTAKASVGVASLEVTWPTAANSWVNNAYGSFLVGKTYRFTADVWVPTGGPDVRIDVAFFSAGAWHTTAKDQWVTIELLWTAQSTLGFYGVAAKDTTSGVKTWVDNVTCVPLDTTYLDAVHEVLTAAGNGTPIAPVLLDGTEHTAVLPATMVWALTESQPATWLSIINDLLASINYRGLWVDENGTYRSEPYQDPKTRPVEWEFDTSDSATNLVGEDRTIDEDVWGIPNWWRFVRRGMATTPVEGDGIYTVENLSRGPSSQESLGRKVRRGVMFLDAADQATLEAQGDRIVIEDTSSTRTLTMSIDPLPIVSHLDVVRVIDGASNSKAEVVSSTVNLDGSPGQWVLEVVE